MKNEHAVELGRKGGLVKSEAKAKAARLNGIKGGRPIEKIVIDKPNRMGYADSMKVKQAKKAKKTAKNAKAVVLDGVQSVVAKESTNGGQNAN